MPSEKYVKAHHVIRNNEALRQESSRQKKTSEKKSTQPSIKESDNRSDASIMYLCDHAGTASATLVRIAAALAGNSLDVRETSGNGGRGGLVLPGPSNQIGSPIAAALYLCRETPFARGRNRQEECK